MATIGRKSRRDDAAEALGKALKAFGETLGNVFDDPEVKKNARVFADSVVDAAAKVVQGKVEDKEVRARFRTVGEAAETLGKSLEEHFKDA